MFKRPDDGKCHPEVVRHKLMREIVELEKENLRLKHKLIKFRAYLLDWQHDLMYQNSKKVDATRVFECITATIVDCCDDFDPKVEASTTTPPTN